jgi:hypothetical protein
VQLAVVCVRGLVIIPASIQSTRNAVYYASASSLLMSHERIQSCDCLWQRNIVVVICVVVRPLVCGEATGVCNMLRLLQSSVEGLHTVAVWVANCLAGSLSKGHDLVTQIVLTVARSRCVCVLRAGSKFWWGRDSRLGASKGVRITSYIKSITLLVAIDRPRFPSYHSYWS